MANSHPRAKRENVAGWSEASTRRNTRFLYSVDERKLTGSGFALSLTVRDCPPTPEAWTKLRGAYFKRLERMGLIRAHWLTEWQRRGVPHMHAAVWFSDPETDTDAFRLLRNLSDHWIDLAGEYGAQLRGQHVKPITDSVGWFQYLSKHAVRGLKHYQRSSDSIPQQWKKTGRMWGHIGEWPTVDPVRFTVTHEGFWTYRRLIQRWRFADARASGDHHRIRSAKRMLQFNTRALSSVVGLGEWITQERSQDFLRVVAALGHEIRC
jgi:hypothetical protein